MTISPEFAILRFLATRAHADEAEIRTACTLTPTHVRARLVVLQSMRLVASQRDPDSRKPWRVFYVIGEGRWQAGQAGA